MAGIVAGKKRNGK